MKLEFILSLVQAIKKIATWGNRIACTVVFNQRLDQLISIYLSFIFIIQRKKRRRRTSRERTRRENQDNQI